METSFKPVTVLKNYKGVPSVLVIGGRRYTLDTITPVPKEVIKAQEAFTQQNGGEVR